MSLVTDVLSDTVAKIEVRSAWGPTFVIDRPFKADGGEQSALVRFLKPQVTVRDDRGSVLARSSPAGDPGITKWPVVVVGLGILLALAVRGASRG